jgi:glycerol-3-phosphate cytidylyltransferase-like family protein
VSLDAVGGTTTARVDAWLFPRYGAMIASTCSPRPALSFALVPSPACVCGAGRTLRLARSLRPWRAPPTCQRLSARAAADGVVVVAGKFDAFHRGHRELARCSSELGAPTLVSFAGMAEALGWPPRASVVAAVERPNVLRAWSTLVGRPVSFKLVPFERVRTLSPRAFLEFVREDLGATGIVCGPDWRFGHRAEGDVDQLNALAREIGDMQVRVVDPVALDGAPNDIVSSTAVRKALAAGDVARAARLMDRPHRLVGFLSAVESDKVQCSDFVNQIPGDGTYQVLVRVLGRAEPVRSYARVFRPGAADPMLPHSAFPNAVNLSIDDAVSVYCEDCEVYID